MWSLLLRKRQVYCTYLLDCLLSFSSCYAYQPGAEKNKHNSILSRIVVSESYITPLSITIRVFTQTQ